ncbi:hypothetical protein OPQ81_008820 [Rhizoctonia solani]|nr:hypothetical protein OPQ81_008820 [Rhizoctonia solani]
MLAFWVALLSFLPAVLSAPVTGNITSSVPCIKPAVRKEWRSLTQDQRDQFHKAVKCLQSKPSTFEVDVSKNLFDDFSYVHYTINRTIHHVSSFFPWHRYFLVLREQAMAGKALGGDGTGETDWVDGFCVEQGPYAGFKVNFPEPHCLTRQFNFTTNVVTNWTKSMVDEIMQYDTYLEFWNNTERHPHDNVHRTVSGDLKRQYSPNEPLFFLHHAQIDRLWTLWQGRNQTRLHDYAGNILQDSTANTASLTDELFTMGLAPQVQVESLMDTLANGLCYTYDDAAQGWRFDSHN